MYTPMYKVIPPGRNGLFAIEHFDVSEKESMFTAVRMAATGRRTEYVNVGKYCRLVHGDISTFSGSILMSDTDMEKDSNREMIRRANGDVLIAGLGIGMILLPILQKSGVTSVTVLEKHQEVIQLVEPSLRKVTNNKLLNILHTDVFKWKPPKGMKWNTIYFDIWNNICADNLEEITRLKRKFARRLNRTNPNAWMGAWMEEELRSRK